MKKIIGQLIRIYRSTPLYPGFGPYLAGILSLFHRLVPRKPFIHEVCGFRIWIDLGQVIDANLYYSGTFEPDTLALMRREADTGDITIDIGANIGLHSLVLSQSVGPKGLVYAIEPNSWAFERLMKNMELNPYSNIICEKLALSDAAFLSSQIEPQGSYPLNGSRTTVVRDIETTTLDEFCINRRIPRINFIKMDVDGMEGRILRGAKDSLMRWKPKLVFELGPENLRNFGDSCESLADFLGNFGYRFFAEKTMKEIPDLKTYSQDIPGTSTINVFARVD